MFGIVQQFHSLHAPRRQRTRHLPIDFLVHRLLHQVPRPEQNLVQVSCGKFGIFQHLATNDQHFRSTLRDYPFLHFWRLVLQPSRHALKRFSHAKLPSIHDVRIPTTQRPDPERYMDFTLSSTPHANLEEVVRLWKNPGFQPPPIPPLPSLILPVEPPPAASGSCSRCPSRKLKRRRLTSTAIYVFGWFGLLWQARSRGNGWHVLLQLALRVPGAR